MARLADYSNDEGVSWPAIETIRRQIGDVYKAVECAPDEQLFHFHENPNQKCPVGKNIHHVLDKRLLEVQRAMEEKLSEMTLADVKKEIAAYT